MKTTIYVEPEVDRALARRAAAEGTTKADLIRRALRAAVERAPRSRPSARGAFTGPSNLSARTDEHLASSGFGES